MLPDGASILLDPTPKIAGAIQMLSPLLAYQAPPFKEALEWL